MLILKGGWSDFTEVSEEDLLKLQQISVKMIREGENVHKALPQSTEKKKHSSLFVKAGEFVKVYDLNWTRMSKRSELFCMLDSYSMLVVLLRPSCRIFDPFCIVNGSILGLWGLFILHELLISINMISIAPQSE